MKIERVCALYFSATGTTEKLVCCIARELARALQAREEEYDFTLPGARQAVQAYGAGDLVLAAVPVYAGRVPNVLRPYLEKNICGSGALAIPLVVYGNRNFDDALIELRDLLEENSLRTVAGAAFIGEHSFSRILAAHRPDENDMALAVEFARKAAEKIAALQELPARPVAVRGETPIRPYYTPRDRQGNPVNILKVKPKTDMEKCSRCGLCAQLCPMGSIDAADPALVSGICIKCCACVKKCPQGAKYYDDERYLYHQHELEEGFARRAEPELFLQ